MFTILFGMMPQNCVPHKSKVQDSSLYHSLLISIHVYLSWNIYIYVIFMYNTMLLWPMWHRDPDTSTPDASTSNRFSVWSHFEAFSQALIAAFKPHWEGLLISGWLWWAKFWHKFDLMFYTIMKASFTDATLHKPVQWPQRKRRGAHGSKFDFDDCSLGRIFQFFGWIMKFVWA